MFLYRNGSTGSPYLKFEKEYILFSNLFCFKENLFRRKETVESESAVGSVGKIFAAMLKIKISLKICRKLLPLYSSANRISLNAKDIVSLRVKCVHVACNDFSHIFQHVNKRGTFAGKVIKCRL